MPIPLYVICSRGTSCDKETGAFSLFEVVEKIQLIDIPVPDTNKDPRTLVIESQPIIITSSWMIDIRHGETHDDEFEFSLKLYMENSAELITDYFHKFKFTPDLTAQRFTIRIAGLLPINESGILLIDSRMRKMGVSDWRNQVYQIVVEKQKID